MPVDLRCLKFVYTFGSILISCLFRWGILMFSTHKPKQARRAFVVTSFIAFIIVTIFLAATRLGFIWRLGVDLGCGSIIGGFIYAMWTAIEVNQGNTKGL
jgi:small neutral amino acid transporter SnatA (MarC family)